MLQFRPAIQLCRKVDSKGIQNQLQVRVICVHEPVQISGKEVYLPFVKGSLDSPSIQAAAPVGIRIYVHTAAVPNPLLYHPHHNKGDHTDQKVRCDMFRGLYINGPGLQITFHDPELVFNLCQAVIFIDHFPCIHGQLRSDDLVVSQALFIFRHLVKVYERPDFIGVQDFSCLLVDALFLEEFPEAFGLDSCDPEVFRMFFQFL